MCIRDRGEQDDDGPHTDSAAAVGTLRADKAIYAHRPPLLYGVGRAYKHAQDTPTGDLQELQGSDRQNVRRIVFFEF